MSFKRQHLRYIISLVALMIWVTGSAVVLADDAVGTHFNRAVQLFEDGKHKSAAEHFEILLEGEVESPVIYYNLGNSYYKSGELGKAIWSYERALLLNARDNDVRWNLDLARKQLQDKAESELYPGFLRWAYQYLDYLTTREIMHGFTLAVGFFLLTIFFITWIRPLRPILSKFIPLLVLWILISGTLVGLRWYQTQYPTGIIQEKEVYVRYGPDDQNTKAFLLHQGTKVSIEKESSSWYFVRFGRRQSGWIPQHAVLKVEP